jgi:hypothetical protein
VDAPKVVAWLKPKLVDHQFAASPVGSQRVSSATAAVERHHPLPDYALVKGVFGSQLCQVADYIGMPAQHQVGIAPRSCRRQPQLIKLSDNSLPDGWWLEIG